MRGIAPAQIPGAKISVCHGVGGMFAASPIRRLATELENLGEYQRVQS
jgi:hypothetical protein